VKRCQKGEKMSVLLSAVLDFLEMKTHLDLTHVLHAAGQPQRSLPGTGSGRSPEEYPIARLARVGMRHAENEFQNAKRAGLERSTEGEESVQSAGEKTEMSPKPSSSLQEHRTAP
jgi:hypothetical protein